MRLVARFADIWNATRADPEDMASLIDVLNRHCDDVGRDPDDIEKTVMLPLVYTADKERQEMMTSLMSAAFEIDPAKARRGMMIGSKDECLEKVAAYALTGTTRFIFMSFAPYAQDEMQAFAEEVAPVARD